MKANKLTISILASFCIALPFTQVLPVQAETTGNKTVHWAAPLLESLQNQKLFLSLNPDFKAFSQPMTGKQFQSLLSELWLSETITLPTDSKSTIKEDSLTRQDAAEQVFAAFKPYLDTKETSASNWIKSAGIMKGYPDGNFRSEEKVTLGQGVAIMKNLKDFLKAQPELASKIGHDDVQDKTSMGYSAKADASGKVEFTLNWGEKSTGGYSITITETKVTGSELHVYYKTKSPGPDDMVTQAFTYPKATIVLDMTLENYKQLTVVLHETK